MPNHGILASVKKVAELDNLFKPLLNKMMTGEVRVGEFGL